MSQEAVSELLQGEEKQGEHLGKTGCQNIRFYWHKTHL